MFCARPSDSPGIRTAGPLLPDLKHVVNVLRADIRPIHNSMEDPHLFLASPVMELCHSVVVSTWTNIKEPVVRLSCLAEVDNPAKHLALLIQYSQLLEDNHEVCRHMVQASTANIRCGQEHGASRRVLELLHEFRAIVREVVR